MGAACPRRAEQPDPEEQLARAVADLSRALRYFRVARPALHLRAWESDVDPSEERREAWEQIHRYRDRLNFEFDYTFSTINDEDEW